MQTEKPTQPLQAGTPVCRGRFKNKNVLLAFDNDGVLRDESGSYQRCVKETVSFFSGTPPTEKEFIESLMRSNNDWERTHEILKIRGALVSFNRVKRHFQELYLGKGMDFSGYIKHEPWLANNNLLARLAESHVLAIVSGAPKKEVVHTLEKNGASGYFSFIWGMRKHKGKADALREAIRRFRPERTYFCDDRPSPIKAVLAMGIENLLVYGILPPGAEIRWKETLLAAGAAAVFRDVNEYCWFLLDVARRM
jgi:phosphoglycolate phosphatase-like HAD superfamily hydrolase